MAAVTDGGSLIVKSEATDLFNREFTVADGTQISKGTLLALTDPRTAAAVGATGEVNVAGIALADKVANDGATTIAAWRHGIFKAVASGAITVGQGLIAGGGNTIARANTDVSGAISLIGHSLETAADGETFEAMITLE